MEPVSNLCSLRGSDLSSGESDLFARAAAKTARAAFVSRLVTNSKQSRVKT
jgi:hypothetical protein